MKWMFSHKKPTAAVFVDFEHWVFSLHKLHYLCPQIQDLYDRISEKYDVKRIFFFGDFTKPALRKYIEDIRKITNNLIDTQNGTDRIIKDYSDFIMLDGIYQDVEQFPKTEVYVLFTGDGHFSSVASYLKNKKKKRLVVYCISMAISNKLKDIADEIIELPTEEQRGIAYQKMIIRNMDYLAQQPRIMYPTFLSTVHAVSRRYSVQEENVKNALESLIQRGIIKRQHTKVNFREIYVLNTDWNAAKAAGLWEPSEA